MAPFSTEKIRNIVLVGHRGCGKTSLAEAAQFLGGAISRLGSVDAGTSVMDFVEEEKARNLSISPALSYVEHNGTKVNIIDAPGYAEFYAEVIPCMWVADVAVLVLDGVAGVEVQTRKVYGNAVTHDQPVIAVVNRLDREHSDFDKVVAAIGESLPGARPVVVQLPIGSQSGLSGVIDLVSMKAVVGKGKDTKVEAIPADMADAAAAARGTLIEEVAGADEALMEKFFENDTLTDAELAQGLKSAVAAGALIPVLACSGLHCIGVKGLLDFIVSVAPSPADRPDWVGRKAAGDEEITLGPSSASPTAAVVWKTMRDPFIGRMSLVRVLSGQLRRDGTVTTVRTGNKDRLSGLSLIRGNQTQDADGLAAGDMGCISKLESSLTGDTLCDGQPFVTFTMPSLPEGMHSAAMEAEARADEDKLSGALAQLAEEDIGFSYERTAETGELIARGSGPLHLQIIKDQLVRKFKVNVHLGAPEIPYRETARKAVRVQGRHKKQTGGRGQFGDVWVRLEPRERGAGFEFVDEIKGGSVPTNYIPAVEKGIMDGMGAGPLARYPVVDIRVILDDGSSHPVDSSDMAFRLAGQIAMRKAMSEGGATLLEPVVNIEVTCPEEILGDVMSDMSGRRGRVQGTEAAGGGMQVVTAQVPLSEIATYSADLTSMSQGRASFSMEMSHYEEVPNQLQEAIIARRKTDEAEEE